jgi:hypothetical protein
MSMLIDFARENPGPATDVDHVQKVPISTLLTGNSPRLNGEDEQHIKVLAENGKPLPPILVHRATMRVIDGMHRLRAAQSRGWRDIEAVFFEGTAEEAFLLAVKANTSHGLPLTLADREAATARIIESYPSHSDRWIATITGLASGTVGTIRDRMGYGHDRVKTRIGRDGKIRPVNSAEGRRLAMDAITANPEASLREIAKIAGISPGTVRDVRQRLKRGANPVPQRLSGNDLGAAPSAAGPSAFSTRANGSVRDRATLLRSLRKDPSLRFTEAGRKLLCWLDSHAAGPGELDGLLASVPSHCMYIVAELARGCGEDWLNLASELGRRPELADGRDLQ